MKRKGFLLDRDGVVNIDHGYVGTPNRFEFKAGILPLLRQARDRGYQIAIVTNQSGVARGKFTVSDYEQTTAFMLSGFRREGIEVDLVLSCFELPDAPLAAFARASFWRKPNPGMILEAALRLDLDLSRSLMLGDSPRDIEAAQEAGVLKCIYLSEEGAACPGAQTIKSLADAAAFL